jgi:hypothetical protein
MFDLHSQQVWLKNRIGTVRRKIHFNLGTKRGHADKSLCNCQSSSLFSLKAFAKPTKGLTQRREIVQDAVKSGSLVLLETDSAASQTDILHGAVLPFFQLEHNQDLSWETPTTKQVVTYHHGISLYWQQFGNFGYCFYMLAKIVLPLRLILDKKTVEILRVLKKITTLTSESMVSSSSSSNLA